MAALMTDHRRSDWLTVDEAARAIGVSPATIKRRIADAKPIKLASGDYVEIEPEKIERPQGHEWRVRISGALPPIRSDPEQSDSKEQPPLSTAQDDSGALMVTLERLAALHVDVRALERENGALRAERDAEKLRADDLAVRLTAAETELAAERSRAAARRWWWPW